MLQRELILAEFANFRGRLGGCRGDNINNINRYGGGGWILVDS